jgi:hypothetical protein
MRTHVRESWLVPLLAVPLTEIALSPILDDEDLVRLGGKQLEGRGRDLARRTQAVIDSVIRAEHSLTDEEALLLVEASHDLLGLSSAFLYPVGFLLAGAGIDVTLTGEPLRRETAKWIAEGPQSPALSAFVITHTLSMTHDPMGWLPRANARYALVTRAIDRRMHDAGIVTWEQALQLAYGHWLNRGWLDLQLWQMTTEQAVAEQYIEEPLKRNRAERDAALTRERAHRARLQATASELESEAHALRPLRDKMEGLRTDAERLRLREAELVQARDRALARIEVLESANQKLEREREELRRRLGVPETDSADTDPIDEEPAAPPAAHEVVYADEVPLPATLLAGREVFFFTGKLRRSSAEAAAESLRELGPSEIRTFCLRKGTEGPDPFPPNALVVVDIRFLGHSQSGMIADRAERSGVQYLAVRSGKGGLARMVAAALQ